MKLNDTHTNLEQDGNFLNLIKSIYEKSPRATTVILIGETLDSIPVALGT